MLLIDFDPSAWDGFLGLERVGFQGLEKWKWERQLKEEKARCEWARQVKILVQ